MFFLNIYIHTIYLFQEIFFLDKIHNEKWREVQEDVFIIMHHLNSIKLYKHLYKKVLVQKPYYSFISSCCHF